MSGNRWLKIRDIRTCFPEYTGTGLERQSTHESTLRAFNILAEVKRLLEMKTPPEVILDVIEVMESAERGK